MADLNEFTITGRLTKDAEFRTLASGKKLLTMDVANNTGYGDFKKTLYVKVQQWGNSGEKVAPYLTKGTLVGLSGSLEINTWTSKEGKDMYTVVVNTNSVQILSKPKDDGSKPIIKDFNNDDSEVVF